MIRRGFWLTAGAVAGIYGYRRASAIGRRISSKLNPAGPGAPVKLTANRTPRGRTVALAAETIRFTRDVREGMELYMARHSVPEGSTLGARGLGSARGLGTDQDSQPKDGR
jgi:hypothetical protein